MSFRGHDRPSFAAPPTRARGHMDPIAPPSAPAPTTSSDPTNATDTLANLDPKEFQTWRETGDLPVREPVAPAEPADDDDEPEPAAAAPAPGASPPVSKRQQRINDQIRDAVAAATKETNAELARLKAAQQPPPERKEPPPQPRAAADPNDPEPDPTDAEKYPLGEYDPKFLRHIAAWDNRQERRQEQAQAQTRARQDQQEQQFRTAAKATSEAFTARTAADPEFAKRLDPRLMESLIPISSLPPDMPGGPYNVIAEEMLANPDTAPDVAEYLSTHPDVLARLTATDHRTGVPLLPARMLIRELGRIEGALKRGVEPPPPPNTITDAPAPPTTLGTRSTTPADASASAIKSGDVAAYLAAENAKELAAHRK